MSLTPEQEELKAAAAKAAEKAFVPASGFRVGAALRTAGGEIYSGCNIEDATYSISVCAERVALFKAVSDGARVFSEILIIGGSSGEEDAPPCGACRQALYQFSPGLQVTYRVDGQFITRSLKELLPDAFTGEEGDIG